MINILLLNWNSSSDIAISLSHLLTSTYKNFRVILIDNFSNKNDLDNLIEIYKTYRSKMDIHLVQNKKNLGYAGGNNSGLRYLQQNKIEGELLILNPDIMISKDTIEKMYISLQNIQDVGGVMVRTKSKTKVLYDYIKLNGLRQYWLTTDLDIINTDYLAGSCMLLKRNIIDKVGLFDENFFMYWEEVDLSFRILDKGKSLISITLTSIQRKENSDTRNTKAIYFYVRNSFYLYKKHPNRISNNQLIIFLINTFLSQLKYFFKTMSLRRLYNYFLGVNHGLKVTLNKSGKKSCKKY